MNRRGFFRMLGLGSVATLLTRFSPRPVDFNELSRKENVQGWSSFDEVVDQGYKFRGLSLDNPIDIHPMDLYRLMERSKAICFVNDVEVRKMPVVYFGDINGECLKFNGIWYRQTAEVPEGSFYF